MIVVAGFHVVPTDMLVSSAGFSDLQNWATQIHQGLVGSMNDAAGMAGADDAGQSFGAKYDPAAQAVVTAVGQAVAQLGGTANGLYTMALNYIKTDSDIADNLTPPQPLARSSAPSQLPQSNAPQCDEVPLNATIPSVIGHNSSTVNEIIAQFWPQGDTGKLRQAGSDWKHLAELISTLGEDGDQQVETVTANSTSIAVDAFAANWAKVHDSHQTVGPLLNSITNAANQLATACDSYAQAVDNLCSNLEELAAGAGIVTGVGVALTFFTFGGSDAVAGAGDAAIAAEAGDAAAAMAAAVEGSADIDVLAEAEAIINEALANLSPVVTDAAATTASGAVVPASASSDMATLVSGPLAPGPGVIGPIPPDPNSPFPNLSPAGQVRFQAWMAQMAVDKRTTTTAMPPLINGEGKPTKQGVIDSRAYQLRVAGDTEYSLYTTLTKANGSQAAMDADGVRSQDGAAIEAKYVGQQPGNCSVYRLNNVDNVYPPVYQTALQDQQWEMQRYGSAINDPRNQVNHVEIDTNDTKAAAYFEAMRLSYGVPGQTRVVP